MFLGLNQRQNSILDANDLIVKILLPKVQKNEIHLQVESQRLDLRCPQYRLNLHLYIYFKFTL
jgi:hypothetical protein